MNDKQVAAMKQVSPEVSPEVSSVASPEASLDMLSLRLNERQLTDLEMLLTGAYAPVNSFLNQQDYHAVLKNMRLASGALWPIPIVLDISLAFSEQLKKGDNLALRDQEGLMLAVLEINAIWQPDKQQEAQAVFGTQETAHPGVAHLMNAVGQIYISGKLQGVQTPLHYAFEPYWQTPNEMRKLIEKKAWKHVLAFQTSRVVHRVQRDFLVHNAKLIAGDDEGSCAILLHPTVGKTRRGDIQAAARVRCYEAVMPYFDVPAQLSLCPMAMRQAGPREALWHAIVERNYGASHFLIGPDDSSPRDAKGEALFYPSHGAHDLLKQHADEIGIVPICVQEWVYSQQQSAYVDRALLPAGEQGVPFRAEALALAIENDEALPVWWSFPEVVDALKNVYRPKRKQGFTLFFTGLSGSGKSTLANILNARLVALGTRPVTLLDGDIVRLNLSNELGFSKAHRNINVKRIGFVAKQITKNGGVAICAPIAPYLAVRDEVRELIEQDGGFIEIHVSTPIEVCEARDVKGLYAKARKGIIPEFTGVSDPYEAPVAPELSINTDAHSPLEAANIVWGYLLTQAYIDDK